MTDEAVPTPPEELFVRDPFLPTQADMVRFNYDAAQAIRTETREMHGAQLSYIAEQTAIRNVIWLVLVTGWIIATAVGSVAAYRYIFG